MSRCLRCSYYGLSLATMIFLPPTIVSAQSRAPQTPGVKTAQATKADAPRAATLDRPAKSEAPQGPSYAPTTSKKTFEEVMAEDVAARDKIAQSQQALLKARYDMSDKPGKEKMSAGRKAVQTGVRVQLPKGLTWSKLAEMSPAEIKAQDAFPLGFRPLPHVNHPTGGQVFPKQQIDAMRKLESRDLARFDADFDLPDHLTPEFPPPIFLTTRPDLGDVSQGEVLSIKNYFRLFDGILTPVQIEGLRLLLTPFPQQQFNQTDDRKVKEASLGVACFDCHTNGHTNAAFHLTPDVRPQAARFRLDTVSLRGVFNQQIHGSKRSLRSIEDFSEFEQRTAYFDGDQVIAQKKGVNLPNRPDQVAMMAQLQNILDFPPAPKLDASGKLNPQSASETELAGEKLFFGKARCGECHSGVALLDDRMHDLHLERFYQAETIRDQYNLADGPIKTFTLRGIKDSPPYMHDGRLLTLDDTVEFFNLVLGTKLSDEEKQALVAYMLCL